MTETLNEVLDSASIDIQPLPRFRGVEESELTEEQKTKLERFYGKSIESEGFTKDDIPPGEIKLTRTDYQTEQVTVSRRVDGSMEERYKFRVTDATRREVRPYDSVADVPQYVNLFLLSEGWYVTDWGAGYPLNYADYLSTFAEILYAVRSADTTFNGALDQELLVDRLYEVSVTLLLGSQLMPEADVQLDGSDERIETSERDEEQLPEEYTQGESETLAQTGHRITSGTGHSPCPNYLHQHIDQTTVLTETPLLERYRTEYCRDADEEIAAKIGDEYWVSTELIEDGNEDVLQIGILTANYCFHERFKIRGEGEYIVERERGDLPSILCVSHLLEQGNTVNNIPHTTSVSMRDLTGTMLKLFDQFVSEELETAGESMVDEYVGAVYGGEKDTFRLVRSEIGVARLAAGALEHLSEEQLDTIRKKDYGEGADEAMFSADFGLDDEDFRHLLNLLVDDGVPEHEFDDLDKEVLKGISQDVAGGMGMKLL